MTRGLRQFARHTESRLAARRSRDKWLTTIRGMCIVTTLAVIIVIVNPLLPWGFPLGGKAWWSALASLTFGLARFWYIAILDRPVSRPAIPPDSD